MTGSSSRSIGVRYYYCVNVMLMCEDSKDAVVVSSKSFKELLGTRTRIPSLPVHHFDLAFMVMYCTGMYLYCLIYDNLVKLKLMYVLNRDNRVTTRSKVYRKAKIAE